MRKLRVMIASEETLMAIREHTGDCELEQEGHSERLEMGMRDLVGALDDSRLSLLWVSASLLRFETLRVMAAHHAKALEGNRKAFARNHLAQIEMMFPVVNQGASVESATDIIHSDKTEKF